MAAEFCFNVEFVGPVEVDVIVLCGGEGAGGLVGDRVAVGALRVEGVAM